MKWTKQVYELDMGVGTWPAEGVVCGDWGIDKRGSQYYLTYLPTGQMAESARTQKFLKELAATEEFQSFDGDRAKLPLLAKAIQQARNEKGWKA